MCHGFVFRKFLFIFFFSFDSMALYSAVCADFVLFHLDFNDHMRYCLDLFLFFFVTVTNFLEQIELPLAMQQSAKTCLDHELRTIHEGTSNVKGEPTPSALRQFVSTAAN